MKRSFTILTAAIALLAFLAIPMGVWGQTRESYNVTYSYSDLGDMLYGSYLDASSYWKVPETSGNNALVSIPITYQPESDITITFRIATFGSGTNPSSSNTTITASGTESNSNWSGSGVNSYPSSSSYVNGVMTITKPQNPTTLGGLDITMGVNTGVKIFRLQSVTVSYTYGGGTPQPTTYTVTYDCNGGTAGCPENVTGIEAGEEITLADAPTKDGFDFDGWNDGNSTYDAGDEYTVNGNVTFTAQWTEVVSGDEQWVLTSLADLTSSDVFVIVGNGTYALPNDHGTTSSPDLVPVSIEGTVLTGTIASRIKWTVSGNATDGFTFYPNGSTNTWLYCNTTASSSSNNNIRIGTGNRKVFKLNNDNYLVTNDTYTNRYLCIYVDNNNVPTDWRGYTNTTSAATMSFYKKVTGGVVPPSITAANVDIEYNATSGNIAYTVNNEIDGGTLTATTESNWLTLGEVGTTVPFTCTANEASTARTATVTLTYTYNRETVTKDVTVTQAAAPLIYTTIPELFEAATGTETSVLVTFNNWVVSGVSTNGKNVFVTDNNGNGFVIYYTTDMSSTFAAGDILSGTAVSCTLKKYNGFAELLNVNATDLTITSGGTVTVADVTMADLAGVNTGALLHYDNLTCEVTTNNAGTTTYYHLTDGTTSIQVYNAIYAFEALVDGKTYNITGIYQQYNNTKEILPRSAEDIEEVEVQHEEYTLTVSNLSHVNLFIFGGEDSETIISTEDGETTAQVYDGTEVLVSIDVEAGYVFQSLTITDGNGNAVETEELTPDEYYSFTMPTSNVTVSATAVEYVAPVGGNYVRITSLDQLTEGSKVIIAARYNESVTNGYYAMKTTLASGKAAGVNFTSTTSEGNEILPTSIVNDEDDYYWIVNETENGYTFTNVNDAKISYNSSTNFNMNGSSADWTIESGTAGNSAMVAGYTGFVIKNYATNSRAFAFNGSVFGPYAWTNNNAAGYNFYLDFFVQTSAPVTETYTLEITGYEEGSNGGYYLIASPVTVDPATVDGMTSGDFDLYYYDESNDYEWRNYEVNPFNLEPGKGYLYAKQATTEGEVFNFTLTGTPYAGNGTVELDYNEDSEFPGFNLIGNPFGTNATLDRPYYRLNLDRSGLNTSTEETEINVMEGVFVEATAEIQTATFSTGAKRVNQLNIKVTRNRGTVLDNAIIRFDNGATLGKFQINQNSTKLYITEGNQDYAVVCSNNEGEMPVNFKAAENGNYTLSVDAENVEVSYLHLIDNMNNADIDLLATPSYSFDARTTDNANRFRLVFNTNGVDENTTTASFAYFNGSEWTISNMGEATLQVVDMMGRVLSTQAISGNTEVSISQVPGVYMLRLINGENVMVQKVVVR